MQHMVDKMLTAKQKRLLEYIDQYLKENGISPSFEEMKEAVGLKSKSGIHRLISALVERGFIRRLPNRARALEVLKMPEVSEAPVAVASPSGFAGVPEAANDDMVSIPLHGAIAAGTPIEALESVDNHISVPQGMVGRGSCFGLTVDGDSMIEMGILDGGTVIIESAQSARDGEIVVALVNHEEATLKTLKRQGQHIALIPANRSHEPQIYPAEQVEVQGRLVGLLRQYH